MYLYSTLQLSVSVQYLPHFSVHIPLHKLEAVIKISQIPELPIITGITIITTITLSQSSSLADILLFY